MSKNRLKLYVFIDALGWELYLLNQWFLEGIVNVRKPLRTVFGYSSACIPSIITGKLPAEHGYWSSFYYSPGSSTFKLLAFFRFLPRFVSDRARVRHLLSAIIKKLNHFSGYFQIYGLPFKYASCFDYQEKYDIFAENGMGACETIFDKIRARNISHCIEKSGSDNNKLAELGRHIREDKVEFAYAHLGELDSLLHFNKKSSPAVQAKLKDYDRQIRAVYEDARRRYDVVDLVVFSDHGMRDTTSVYDLMRDVEALDLTFGKDYAAFYDSTMARFWFLNDGARAMITDRLSRINAGRILSDEELKSFGVYFENHKYGDLIFLMEPGIMIAPSFMGRKSLPGMHGFHPDDPDSRAAYFATRESDMETESITDVFNFDTMGLE